MQRNYVTIRPLNREDSVLYFPPEAFGPFRVLHQIGAGTLGPVFRAYEPGGNRDRLVAVKVFRLDLTPEQTSALVAELKALAGLSLSHPNIAAPIAAGIEHGAAFLAQEYAVGDSLDVVLRERGTLPLEQGVALVDALAGAIDYAAAKGVHHGSLHLRDLLIDGRNVRVTGFGVANALTKVGARRPTRPQYSSPDGSSDVFSLGTIAFEAIAGKRVSPDNLADFEERFGRELRSAFSLALAPNPQMRPDRAGDFAAVLRDAAEMTTEAAGNAVVAPFEAPVADDTAQDMVELAEPIVPPPAEEPMQFDVEIDRAPAFEAEIADDPADRLAHAEPPPPPPPAQQLWPAPPQALSTSEPVSEVASRRWPLIAVLVVSAVLGALSVGFFLRSPRQAASTEPDSAVDETTVDLPAGAAAPPAAAPAASADAPAPRPAAAAAAKPEPQPARARNATTPAPVPSRPASGAVRRTPTGNLLIRSTPADADVLVNGQVRGKTPLALRELALGSYNIRVARDGYVSEERTLQLTSRRPTFSTTINLRPVPATASSRGTVPQPTAMSQPADTSGAGGLNVQSRPPGARVYVNDRLAGSTPVAIPNVPAGGVTVRIELDGYEPWMTKVLVNAGNQTQVGASLERK